MDDPGGLRDLRRLRIIGVGAPVLLLLLHEAFRVGVLDAALPAPVSSVAATLSGVAGAIVFAFAMFFLIDRTQRHILQKNRDLAIVNAASTATDAAGNVEEDLQAALGRLLEVTGAREATATLHPIDADLGTDLELRVARGPAPADALADPEGSVEIPLAIGSTSAGTVRLLVPVRHLGSLPSASALAMLGRQLGAAVQRGQLIADLNRRKEDGHTFYASLLQISNQAPLAEAISTILVGARQRLAADEAHLCLTRPVLEVLRSEPTLGAAVVSGQLCELPTGEPKTREEPGRQHRCVIAAASDFADSLRAPVLGSGELLGDLFVARRSGQRFTERDRRYLFTLAGIAAIAITAARLRERERQAAILSERDRIARELHDSMAQVLGSTHLRLRALLATPAVAARPEIGAELADLADVAREAYRDVREAILGLRESSGSRGFLEAVQAYLDKYAEQTGLRVRFETSTPSGRSLPVHSEIQVLRVIQEALTNVRKHAGASMVRVRLGETDGGGLTIEIDDDGRGFDPAATRTSMDGGFGLQAMRERMEIAGGALRIESAPGSGTRVIASVPAVPGLAESERESGQRPAAQAAQAAAEPVLADR